MGRVCGRLLGGPFLVTGLQVVKTMENHKTASLASGHGCLQEGVTFERFLLQGFEWENFLCFAQVVAYGRWSLTRGGRTWRLACNRVL